LDDATATRVSGGHQDGKPDKTAEPAYLLARYLGTADMQTAVSLSQFARGQYHSSIPVFYEPRHNATKAEAEANAGQRAALIDVDADGLRVSGTGWSATGRPSTARHTNPPGTTRR
jgi:hypothetical protein